MNYIWFVWFWFGREKLENINTFVFEWLNNSLLIVRMPKDTKGLEYVKEKMPQIGLGTYLIKKNDELRDAVETALECGYRFIDTAQVYRNEAFVGRAVTDFLPKFGLDRLDEFFVKAHSTFLGLKFSSLQNLTQRTMETKPTNMWKNQSKH